MGSSLVKPSLRESRRRGVNAASASRGDAPQKDEGYKVDTLAIPVSNYCKPVTVVSQNNTLKNASLPPQVSRSSDALKEQSSSGVLYAMNPEYISPVLKKNFSNKNMGSMQTSRPSGAGSGDSSVLGIPSVRGQRKSSSRRNKIFSGSCLGRRDETQKSTTELPSELANKDEMKSKGNDEEIDIVEPEHDDQDVSRDARTRSPQFKDSEKVIDAEPTTLKPRASTSSPIDNYTPLKDSDAVEEESLATVSITKSENPATLYQGELRCELSKKKVLETSATTFSNDLTQNQVRDHGDPPFLITDRQTETQKDVALHDLDKPYAQGDLVSERVGGFIENETRPISRNSDTEKQVSQDCEDENSLQVFENVCVDVDAHNESGVPEIISRLITVEPVKQYLRTEEQRSPLSDNKLDFGAKNPKGDFLAELTEEKLKSVENVYICANLKLETRTLSENSALQGSATGVTKYFCDVNVDYDNGDDQHKPKAMHLSTDVSDTMKLNNKEIENVQTTDVLNEIGNGGFLNVTERRDETSSPAESDQKKEQRAEHTGVYPTCATNKSEPDMLAQTRMGRLNCWRPESGGCTKAQSDKDKRQREEHRPASWSHINPEQQLDMRTNMRPCSAATGDTMWGNEGAINIAMAVISTSSSALDPSPSPSASSLPRRHRSQASVDNYKSCHSEEMDLSEASNKSTCRSLRESRIRSVTSKTSFNGHGESFNIQSTPDSVRPLSAQSLTNGKLHRSRPTSAQSSQILAVEPINKLSQQSLPQLSARSSRHNLSRSLSNHSSGSNAIHSPRPPSSDSLKHSPRPPSGQSEEGGLRKVRSRPSSVQLSESMTTAVQRFSNHSLSKEPTKKSSFHIGGQNLNQQTYTANKEEDDTLTRQNPLSTSQLKLPPIKASTNLGEPRQVSDTWTSKSQPMRLPPVISVGSSVPLRESNEMPADRDAPSSWPSPGVLRGSALPPVLGREEANIERTSMVGKRDNTIDSWTNGESTVHTSSFPMNDYTCTMSSNEQLETADSVQNIGKLCPSPTQEETILQEKSELGDPKPSPTGSQTGVDEVSHSHSLGLKSTSDDIARLLATYLPHKYSPPADTATAPDDGLVHEAPSISDNHIAEEETLGNAVNKVESCENSDAGTNESSVNYPECTTRSSDICTKDTLGISSEQKNDSVDYLSYVTNDMPNHFSYDLSNQAGEFDSSKQLKMDGIKEAIKDISVNETTIECKPNSPTSTDYKSVLTCPNLGEEVHYTDMETEVEEKESSTEWKSNLNEGHDIKSLLQRYSIRNSDTNPDNEDSGNLPDDKSETADKLCPTSTINTLDTKLSADAEYTSNSLLLNPTLCMSTFEQTYNSPSDNFEAREQVRLPNETNEHYKPKSDSSGLDIASLMAKYTTTISDEKPSIEGAAAGESTDPQEDNHTLGGNFTLDSKSEALACEVKDSGDDYKDLDAGGGDLKVGHHKDNYLSNQDSLMTQSDELSTEKRPVFDCPSLVVNYSSGDTENIMSVQKNYSIENKTLLDVDNMKNDLTNIPACPENDQSDLSKDESGFCSLVEPKSTAPEEAMNLPKPFCLEKTSEKKLDSELHTLSDDTDYMSKLTEKVPNFGERVADISSLTTHHLSPGENKTTEDGSSFEISAVTNVYPMGATDDETVKNREIDSQENLKEPITDDLSCAIKSEPIAKVEDVPGDTAIEPPFTDKWDTTKSEDDNLYSDENTLTKIDNKLEIGHCENISDGPNTALTLPEEHFTPETETNLLEKEQSSSTDEKPNSEDSKTKLKDNLYGTISEYQSPSKDLFPQENQPFEENEKSDETKKSPLGSSCSNDDVILNNCNVRQKDDTGSSEFEQLENINELSLVKETLEEKEQLSMVGNGISQTITNESNSESNMAAANIQHSDNSDVNCSTDVQQNDDNKKLELQGTCHEPITSEGPHCGSPSQAEEESLEPQTPELLPTERIDTIKKQIYEEGLKPCQRDGGVAFFIPVSNAGLQPPVANQDIGERLAKPKKSSMSYEERMIMADINRQEQLTKKKEFAIKDLINVKSATTSSSSASGENISGGGGHQDRSDRSDSSSLH